MAQNNTLIVIGPAIAGHSDWSHFWCEGGPGKIKTAGLTIPIDGTELVM